MGEIPRGQRPRPRPVRDGARGAPPRHDQTQGINQQMAFAPFDSFVSVKTDVRILRGLLNALTINRACRGLRRSPLATTLRMTQLLHHTRPQSLVTPTPEIAINRIPVAKVLGQHTPLTAGLIDIENSID